MNGRLDFDVFHRAWNKLLERHPALRTAFVWEGLEAPMQVVRKSPAMPICHHDWATLSAEEAQTRFDSWFQQDVVVSFELSNAPLCRVDLFSFTPETHRLVWVCHHAIADGWSIGIALEELLTLASGVEHTLLPVAPRYRSHIAWLLKRSAADDERFWRQYLGGFKQRNSIDLAQATSSTLTSERRHYTARLIGADGLKPIIAASKAARVTLNTMFQVAWALVLGRYAASDDVVFGVVSSGRPDSVAGVERMIGLLVTTTPMRVRIRDSDTVRSLLKRLQADVATIRQYEHAPLTNIHGWSDIPPGETLFDSLYVFGNYPPQTEPAGSPLHIESVDIKAPSTFPLAILVDPDGEGGVVVRAVTDPCRFDDEVAQRIVDAVVSTAHALADNLNAVVTTIDCLSEGERELLETLGQGDALDLPCDDVVQAIEEIAARQPSALAVVGGGGIELSYADLLSHARSAAQILASHGIEPGEPVITLVDRGPKAIVGILSILLAGGAYVPLDPTYPRTRRVTIIENSQARFVVTAGYLANDFDGLTVINLDSIDHSAPPLWGRPNVPSETPAYIIYTSGSSGRPKGVVVSRANLAYSNTARQALYGDPPKAFLLLSSLAFDSSVAGLFWTLSTGGVLVVSEHRLEQDIEQLAAQIAAYEVTHLLSLPSLYAVLLEQAEQRQLTSLTHAIVAGEPCPASVPAVHRKVLPAAKLMNEYGPTEATVWCIASDITETPNGEIPSIGRPIPGTTIRLIDHRNRPVPEGVTGEVAISGPGVAIGYHSEPDLTATTFVSSSGRGDRVYRTGDFARWRMDGTLDYLGRRDGQIKVRGHRVEIQEIEDALLRAPYVRAGVAAVIPNPQNSIRLAAFVESDSADMNAVREGLEDQLPAAMIPELIKVMSALPCLPNGKIDRKTLIQSAEKEIENQRTDQYQPPTSPIEHTLVAIWKSVLKVEHIGVRDNFFSLGGDSLSSIRIVSLAKREGIGIKPTSVLEYPTIEALAKSMALSDESPKTVSKPSARTFFMVHGGERMRELLQGALPDGFLVHQFEDHWDDGCLPPTTSVRCMADEYLADLRNHSPHGPYLLGGYSIGAAVSVVMAQKLIEAGEEVVMLFLLDPLDRIEFFGGVRGLDPETLAAVSVSSTKTVNQSPSSKRQNLEPRFEFSNFFTQKYHRYIRGPARLLLGSLAYYSGHALSPRLASDYAWIVYNLAIRRHELTPYSGSVLVFRSIRNRDSSQTYVWAKLARGDYKEERFDCEHLAFRRDPEVVRAWTRNLADHLRRLT